MIDKKNSLINTKNNIDQAIKIGFGELTLKQKVLFFIEDCGGNTTVKNILENFSLAKSNLALLLADLVNEGLIEKKKSKTDKRSIKIYVTKQGHKEATKNMVVAQNALIEKFGKARFKQLCNLCDQINEILKG